jgi:hypothetical protein
VIGVKSREATQHLLALLLRRESLSCMQYSRVALSPSSMPSGRLSLMWLAWRQLNHDRAPAAELAFAILLTLLPEGLLVVGSFRDRNGAVVVTTTTRVVVAMLMTLVMLVIGVVSHGYLQLRLRELALLRARGWSRGRVALLVLTQLLMLATPTAATALVGLLLVVSGTDQLGPGLSFYGPTILMAGLLPLTTTGWLFGLAWWAAGHHVLSSVHNKTELTALFRWQGVELDGLLALPAAGLLLLRRSLHTPGWGTPAALDNIGGTLLTTCALVLLLVAISYLMSLAAEVLVHPRSDIEGTLAKWQLHRWWQRHIGSGALIILAVTAAALTAIALRDQGLDQSVQDLAAGAQGSATSLAVGFGASVIIGVLAYGVVFLSACRSRMDDYRALLVDGLAVDAVRRSIELEQATVLTLSLVAGIGLAWVLLWANAPAIGFEDGSDIATGSLSSDVATLGVTVAATIGILAAGAVAWYARRTAVRFDLLMYQQRRR